MYNQISQIKECETTEKEVIRMLKLFTSVKSYLLASITNFDE